jgi:T-complex protein 1 subunit theta
VIQQNDKTSRVATIVLRGSTENAMDDIERAVDDGVNTFKALTKVGTHQRHPPHLRGPRSVPS